MDQLLLSAISTSSGDCEQLHFDSEREPVHLLWGLIIVQHHAAKETVNFTKDTVKTAMETVSITTDVLNTAMETVNKTTETLNTTMETVNATVETMNTVMETGNTAMGTLNTSTPAPSETVPLTSLPLYQISNLLWTLCPPVVFLLGVFGNVHDPRHHGAG